MTARSQRHTREVRRGIPILQPRPNPQLLLSCTTPGRPVYRLPTASPWRWPARPRDVLLDEIDFCTPAGKTSSHARPRSSLRIADRTTNSSLRPVPSGLGRDAAYRSPADATLAGSSAAHSRHSSHQSDVDSCPPSSCFTYHLVSRHCGSDVSSCWTSDFVGNFFFFLPIFISPQVSIYLPPREGEPECRARTRLKTAG